MKDRALRFWRRVDTAGDCWLWEGEGDGFGYGRSAWADRKRIQAHRAAWMLHNDRPIPDGMKICHTCDNRICVRPAHLFLGSQADNIADMVAKGRHYEQRKEGCDNGHLFDEANTYRKSDGGRKCRTCAREFERRKRVVL